MRRDRFLALSLLLAATGLGACSNRSGQAGAQAQTPDPAQVAKPRAVAFQHDYVASPGEHFDRMAEESKLQEAERKAEEQALAATKGGRKGSKRAAGAHSASAFPAPATAPSGFPTPSSAAPSFPVPAAAPPAAAPQAGFPVPGPAPAPTAQVPCVANPCIGGDPCVVRRPPQECPPAAEPSMSGTRAPIVAR